MLAGRQAERLFALDQALGFYERARECAEGLERPEALAEAEERMGRVRSIQGAYVEAVAHFERAIALLPSPSRRAAIKSAIGEVYGRIGDPRGLPYIEQALAELDPASQANELALATAMRGRLEHYRGHHAQAITHFEHALALAEPGGEPGTLGLIYSFLAGAYQHLARHSESDRWARRSIELGERRSDPMAVASGYEFMAENASLCGRVSDTLAHAARDLEIGLKIGSLDRQAWSYFPAARAHHVRGDLDAAERTVRQCIELCRRMGERRLEFLVTASELSPLQADRGDFDAARASAEAALAAGDESGLSYLRTQALYAFAHLAYRRGEWQTVLDRCRECEEILVGADSRVTRILLGPIEAGALLALGRPEDAWARSERGLAEARDAENDLTEGILQSVRGQILAALGRPAEARGAFDAGIAILERLDAPIELERARERRAAAGPLC
jgi:tetratricopeptide (TPR) repeat protein